MRWAYKTIRALLVTAIILIIVVPIGLYITLSIPFVQNKIKEIAEERLTEFLDMPVSIGSINIAPFNRVSIQNVVVRDSLNNPAIEINRLGASLNIADLIFKKKWVMNYAELIGLRANITKETPDAPLNIQPLIEALSSKDDQEKKQFEFRFNTIVLRKSEVNYNVLSEDYISDRFDPNHIKITNLRADLRLPVISNNNIEVNIRRLAFFEQSGVNLKEMNGTFRITDNRLTLKGFNIELPDSRITLSEIDTPFDKNNISFSLKNQIFNFDILEGSHIYLPDLSSFIPLLRSEDKTLYLSGNFSANSNFFNANNFVLNFPEGDSYLRADFNMLFHKPDTLPQNFEFEFPNFELRLTNHEITSLASAFVEDLRPEIYQLINNLGYINIDGHLKYLSDKYILSSSLSSNAGRIEISGELQKVITGMNHHVDISTEIYFPELAVNKLTQGLGKKIEKIGIIDGLINANFQFGEDTLGVVDVELNRVQYNGRYFNDIKVNANIKGDNFNSTIFSLNPGLELELYAEGNYNKIRSHYNIQCNVNDFDWAIVSDENKSGKKSICGHLTADLSGNNLDDLIGEIEINDFTLVNNDKIITIQDFDLRSIASQEFKTITLNSDIVDGVLEGNYSLSSLAQMSKTLLYSVLPSLIPERSSDLSALIDNWHYDDSATLRLTIKSTGPLGNSFDLPIAVIYPVEITGSLNGKDKNLKLNVYAPYLQQKNKLIENSSICITIENIAGNTEGRLSIATIYPTKKGDMSLGFNSYAYADNIDSHFSWKVNRERDFHGDFDISTSLYRSENSGKLYFTSRINPSELVFNDTIWNVNSATVSNRSGILQINDFKVGHDDQYISINGKISNSDDDNLFISLKDVNLDYIFETLDIEKAMFGGTAYGEFVGSALLSDNPIIHTSGLKVDNLKYNHSLMGNATLLTGWNQQNKSIDIQGVIHQPNGRESTINGAIFPMADSLDFHFDADKIDVGFMLPYMNAFTSEVSGYASGKARLWGNFKYIDMTGVVFAEDVKIKLDFTNTAYLATDTIILTPGHIELDNVTIRDIEGKTALVNGYIDHEFFKQPRFEFKITDAEDMLVYDIPEHPDLRWYGKIYGNGSATVTGYPGVVNIGVNMSTAPRSTFTFVLLDAEEAFEYNFITFKDRNASSIDTVEKIDKALVLVNEIKDRISKKEESGSESIYNMNIAVDVNPQATVTIIMDPAGGDKIKAYGNGNLRMTYDSADEDFRMYGTYTLTKGDYNFTLQDIIIKDFTIREGSSITFQGDPYAANLDLKAVYSVNANLSDLDESFLQDKEVNRTKVPVYALLKVNGDIRQPDINFDLEFPTLTQDTYRKVRSIVSTEEMMNRQIIYLLALSRFYTPDYMNTTKGNEFVSVASSTISSQLSSMLGQLSENWSISPNFRSDKGDFSDVEVDLGLSSSLLNNRLLLNGNFGYRDKSMNNNTFIGDFDIEYLLNRTGSLRLKAYNRYNDRNYYLKSALTTQGVGVVFKRDFDNMFSFLRKRSKKKQVEPMENTNSNDSIPQQGPTLILPSVNIGNDTIPADTIINNGRFEVDFDNLH